MELEKLNNQYNTDRAAYETLNADKKKMQALKLAAWDAKAEYRNLQIENERAKLAGQKIPHDKAKLESAKKKAEQAIKDLEEFKKQIEEALGKVNTRYSELEQDPEMKAHLNTILAKRMERSIKKEEAKRDSYKEIKEIFEKHPNAKNLIKGIANKNKELAILEDKIKKLEEKQARTPAEDTELKNRKLQLVAVKKDLQDRKDKIEKEFLQKHYPNLSDETKAVLFGLNTVDMDKAIKGTERNIQNRKNVYRQVVGKEFENSTERQGTDTRKASSKNLPVKHKLPWYKRLWNWIKGDEIEEPETRKDNNNSREENSESKFRNSYKYKIVQDYIQEKEAELLKQNSERKKSSQKEQNER